MSTYESSESIEFTRTYGSIEFIFENQDEITITADDASDQFHMNQHVLFTLTKEEAQALTRFLVARGF